MKKSFAIWGAAFALTATMLGALGAHALRAYLDPHQLESFKTGTQYQFYHALALLIMAVMAERAPNKLLNIAAYLLIAGVFCFSGSIYLLTTPAATGLPEMRFLGPVTPLGGLCFMAGWVLAIFSFFRSGVK